MDNNISMLLNHYVDLFDTTDCKKNCFHRWFSLFFEQHLRLRFVKTIAACQPVQGKWVLDVGCGSGRYAILMANSGAEAVTGIDLSPELIEIAAKHALRRNLSQKCHFVTTDFMKFQENRKYNYAIVMGVMEYIAEPKPFIEHLLELTSNKILLSFPNDKGFLIWQRNARYRKATKKDLNLYTEQKIRDLLNPLVPRSYTIDTIPNEFFVIINR